jgi:hypothetical protein
MVLHAQVCGRVGHCRDYFFKAASLTTKRPFLCTSRPQDEDIRHRVDPNHQAADDELRLARQSRWIEHGKDVVRHEVTRVILEPGASAQRVLERRQRADPAREFDIDRPRRRRQMDPGHPRPAQRQHSPERREHHEAKVSEDDERSSCAIRAQKKPPGCVGVEPGRL